MSLPETTKRNKTRSRSRQGSLADAFELLLYLSFLLAGAFVLWVWHELELSSEVRFMGYIVAAFALVSSTMLCLTHGLRLFRRLRREWRRTFIRRR